MTGVTGVPVGTEKTGRPGVVLAPGLTGLTDASVRPLTDDRCYQYPVTGVTGDWCYQYPVTGDQCHQYLVTGYRCYQYPVTGGTSTR